MQEYIGSHASSGVYSGSGKKIRAITICVSLLVVLFKNRIFITTAPSLTLHKHSSHSLITYYICFLLVLASTTLQTMIYQIFTSPPWQAHPMLPPASLPLPLHPSLPPMRQPLQGHQMLLFIPPRSLRVDPWQNPQKRVSSRSPPPASTRVVVVALPPRKRLFCLKKSKIIIRIRRRIVIMFVFF